MMRADRCYRWLRGANAGSDQEDEDDDDDHAL